MNKIIIKTNNNPMPNNCPLCNRQTNPNIGAELFLENTDQIVCLGCATKQAPILACFIAFADYSRFLEDGKEIKIGDLLFLSELSGLFQKAEISFGEKWANEQEFVKSPMNTYQNV